MHLKRAVEIVSLLTFDERLDAIVDLSVRMSKDDWLELLGRFWTKCDWKRSTRLAELRDLLLAIKSHERFMIPIELIQLRALPEVVAIERDPAWDHADSPIWRLRRGGVPDAHIGHPTTSFCVVNRFDVLALKATERSCVVFAYQTHPLAQAVSNL
jgi:hypothetical protein